MKEFWLSLTQDNKVSIITTIATVLPVVLGAVISIFQITNAKKREIEAKSHEQRKEKYEELLNVFKKTFTNVEKIKQGELPFSQEQWFEVQLGLAMYASSDVYSKYLEFRKIAEEAQDLTGPQKLLGIVELGNLILLMRKEVGFSDDKVDVRDVLSTFITDIYDPMYDGLFKRNDKIYHRFFGAAQGILKGRGWRV